LPDGSAWHTLRLLPIRAQFPTRKWTPSVLTVPKVQMGVRIYLLPCCPAIDAHSMRSLTKRRGWDRPTTALPVSVSVTCASAAHLCKWRFALLVATCPWPALEAPRLRTMRGRLRGLSKHCLYFCVRKSALHAITQFRCTDALPTHALRYPYGPGKCENSDAGVRRLREAGIQKFGKPECRESQNVIRSGMSEC